MVKPGNNNRVAVNCMVERKPTVMTHITRGHFTNKNGVLLLILLNKMHLILLNVALRNVLELK